MSQRAFVLALLVLLPFVASSQSLLPALQPELNELDSVSADIDQKLIVVQAIAEDLGFHRNHLMLVRRETGQSYGSIYISELRRKGIDDEIILERLRALNRRIRASSGSGIPPSHMDFLFRTGVDQSGAGTFYFAVPEISFTWRRIALAVDIPYYRAYGASSLNAGMGDVHLTTRTGTRFAGFDFMSALTLGFPTGDTNKGLGAGKTTADLSGTVAKRFERVRPWITAGVTNSVFDNVGYRRPYVSDGNAIHLSGGLDVAVRRGITLGFAGFALRPLGSQTVYSDMMSAGTSSPPTGTMPGSGGGMGHIMPPGMGAGDSAATMPFYERSQQAVVTAEELGDHGASAWMSVPLRRGFVFTTAVARSIPFHLTTVRIGLSVDIGAAFRLRLP